MHQYLMIPILFMISCFISPASSQSQTTKTSYYHHCNSIVPKSLHTNLSLDSSLSFQFSPGNFSGGYQLFPQNHNSSHFHFRPHNILFTTTPSILSLDATLILFNGRTTASFDLAGFWSQHNGQLCMVGAGSRRFEKGLPLSAVFKLNLPKISNISNSVKTGTLHSLDPLDSPSHFDPVFLLVNSQIDYMYTLIQQFRDSCEKMVGDVDSLAFKFDYYFCRGDRKLFELEDQRTMILSGVRCSRDGKFRFSIDILNHVDAGYVESFVPNRTLVGEGFWDRGKDRLCFIGCSVLTLNNSLDEANVGDCDIGFSLWFPAVLNLTSRSSPIGKMWSNRAETDPKHFNMVQFRSPSNDELYYTCSEYDYTVFNTVKELRLKKWGNRHVKKKRWIPDAEDFNGMNFRLSLRSSEGKTAVGYAVPLFIGEQVQCDSFIVDPRFNPKHNLVETRRNVLVNVSYSIKYELTITTEKPTIFSKGGLYVKEEEISAEGIYNRKTGMLYMVGCKATGSLSIFEVQETGGNSSDCKILMEIQVPTLYSERSKSFNGTVWSSREKSDPLYFEPVEISSHGRIDTQTEWELLGIDESIITGDWVGADKYIVMVYFIVVYAFIGLLFFLLKRPNMRSNSS